MRITVFGKGNVGGGLADLWERAGHQVTRLGRGGGDVSTRMWFWSQSRVARSPRRSTAEWC